MIIFHPGRLNFVSKEILGATIKGRTIGTNEALGLDGSLTNESVGDSKKKPVN